MGDPQPRPHTCHAKADDQPVTVGDLVLVRDWRTGQPYGVRSIVQQVKVEVRGADCARMVEGACARCNRDARVILVTSDHVWAVLVGQWLSTVLEVSRG